MAVEPGNPTLPPDVDGSIERPRRWIWVWIISGMTATIFSEFCEHMCASIENSALDEEHVFLWDNLQAHLTPLVYHTVEGHQGNCTFHIIPRPPYQPKFGPIEYIFVSLFAVLKIKSRRIGM
jgi:hypothetical protein